MVDLQLLPVLLELCPGLLYLFLSLKVFFPEGMQSDFLILVGIANIPQILLLLMPLVSVPFPEQQFQVRLHLVILLIPSRLAFQTS